MKDFLPKTLRDWLVCLLLAALTPISINLWWNARLGMRQANGTLQNVNQMSARGDEWLGEQLATLRSEQYQTLMRNNLAAGSYLQSITNSLNRSTIPLLNRNLTSSNEGLQELRRLLQSGNVMLVDVNRVVSAPGGVLPQTALLLAQLTDTTRALANSSAIRMSSCRRWSAKARRRSKSCARLLNPTRGRKSAARCWRAPETSLRR